MRQATLCFLIKDNKVLLAMKKRGFGVGKWNGPGGKVHEDTHETVEQAAVRETQEEVSVTPLMLEKVAEFKFTFPHNLDWGQTVHVFLCYKWSGEPKESEEMKPKWFDKDKLPYKKMWADDSIWMARVLAGKHLEADFEFDENNKITKYNLKELN